MKRAIHRRTPVLRVDQSFDVDYLIVPGDGDPHEGPSEEIAGFR
jgi:hypothetical protein